MNDDEFESLRKRVSDKTDANMKHLNKALEKRLPAKSLATGATPAASTQADMQAASALFAPDITATTLGTPTPYGADTSLKAAQPPAPTGQWRCIVNSHIVSIDLIAHITANGSLSGRGTITYIGTSRIINVQGPGDWSALPPDASSPEWLFKFRMQPSNHALFSWYARPTESPNHLRHRFVMPDKSGIVETSCERIG